MKAIDRPFTKIINGTTQFVIPVFQRDYSWSDKQCDQLWEDVVRIGRSGSDRDRGHFMGSLVYVPSGDTAAGFTRWLLIDGQQRMTTVTLLLLALRRHLRETGWESESEDGPTAKKIDAYFLKNLEEKGGRVHKLVLRRHDQVALAALLDDKPMPADGASRIVENYESFCRKVATEDPEVVYAGIGRLVVVDVTLDRASDDPQMIFESLNSTGLSLTQADLIRNFILMRVPEPLQTRLYEDYWRKIEHLFRGAGRAFDAFARDYMALMTKAPKQVRADDIYHEFREFFREREGSLGLEGVLAEMLRFAEYHAAFSLARGDADALGDALARLNRLAEVAAILVMRLSDLHHRAKTLSKPEFLQALQLLESYVFRRAVCGMDTRGYGPTFANLAYRVKEDAPLDSLKVSLRGLRESYRFPRDEEFEKDLKSRDIYSMRIVHYLLEQLENHGSREPTDTSRYTVEHILPQNERLAPAWREMLGTDWPAIQQTWLHRLGNLTLTGYNSTYSDRPFEDKKTIAGGFADSSVRLNKFVRDQPQWTQVEIEARGTALAAKALKVWPRLEVGDGQMQAQLIADLKIAAGQRTLEAVPMSDPARALFELLRPQILALGPGIIEKPESKSIVYHAADGDFFMEVLPRTNRLVLLLNLDFADCDHSDDRLGDATEKTFFVNARNAGGAFYRVTTPEHLERALRHVKQAHEAAAA